MKKLTIILFLVILSSCERPKPSYIQGGNETNNIHYLIDYRTGLCFAERGAGNTYAMTCVPCNDKVLDLIKYGQ